MPVTYNLIASNTLSSSAASVTFSAIPGTYTDLLLRITGRGIYAEKYSAAMIQPNANGYNTSSTYLEGTGTTASSGRAGLGSMAGWRFYIPGSANIS